MKPTHIQILCGAALAVMSAAGASHWWSVKQFVAAVESGIPVPTSHDFPMESAVPALAKESVAPREVVVQSPAPAKPSTADVASQQKFYESLVDKLQMLEGDNQRIKNQNRDLIDQVAETNRDLMNLQFRVDTHSESFRPLPVNEERLDTSFDDGPGVLPPRAEPVFLPSDE